MCSRKRQVCPEKSRVPEVNIIFTFQIPLIKYQVFDCPLSAVTVCGMCFIFSSFPRDEDFQMCALGRWNACFVFNYSVLLISLIYHRFVSGRVPISTSLNCSSGVLSYSFVWNILLCCLFLSKFLFVFLCMWKVIYFSWLCRSGPLWRMSYVSQQYTPLSSPKGQWPTDPRVGAELCLRRRFHKLPDCIFLASGVCCLVFEGGLEVWADFLVGEASACPLVGGARSWPSGGQGHVKGCV